MYLHCVYSDVFSFGSSEVSIRTAGRSGDLRDVGSYMWSRTIVPTMAMYLLSAADEHVQTRISRLSAPVPSRNSSTPSNVCASDIAVRCARRLARDSICGCFLAFCVLSTLLVFVLGRDFLSFRRCGQIRLHFRARHGLRIEETRAC